MMVHLTKVYRATQDKKGNPYISKKSGKPYERVSIKTQEHGEKWLSGFGGDWNRDWADGDAVNITVVEAGEYTNFERIDPIEDLTVRVEALEKFMLGTNKKNNDDDNGDLPF